MPAYIKKIKNYLNALFMMPYNVQETLKLRQNIAQTSALANATMQLLILRDIAPDIYRKIAPTFAIPEAFAEDIAGWYGASSTNNLIKNKTASAIYEIARLGFMLPREQTIDLYESALALAGTEKTKFFSTYLDFLFRFGEERMTQAVCEQFLARSDAWEKGEALAWMRVIGFMLRIGDEQQAASLLQVYQKKRQLRAVEEYPQIASFAITCGLKNAKIVNSASCYQALVANREAGLLRQFFHKKQVAVIGNGPQECGSGRGSKIDAYDIVIRMNDFTARENNVADYGEKFTVWALNEKYRKPLLMKTLPSSFVWITQCLDYNSIPYEHVRNLTALLKKKMTLVDFSPQEAKELERALLIPCDYLRPTSGVKIAAYIRMLTDARFGPEDVYALSCKETPSESHNWQGGEYAYSDGTKSSRETHPHSLHKEHKMFTYLFSKECL